jgi:hypothetical protein
VCVKMSAWSIYDLKHLLFVNILYILISLIISLMKYDAQVAVGLKTCLSSLTFTF